MRLTRRRVHEILDQTRRTDRAARLVNTGLVILIVANIAAVILESVQEYNQRFATGFLMLERASVAIFSVEYLLRVWVAPAGASEGETGWRARLRFMLSPDGIIDLLAILPALLAFLIPVDLRALRALRLLRLLKLTRYSAALSLLTDVIRRERSPLLACLFILSVLIVVAATGAYLAEHRAQPDKFGSIPMAMWWAIITLTTIGYGDTFPVTPLGQMFGAVIAVLGVGMAALPAGILATGFADQLAQRRREFEDRYFRALADGVIDEREERELELLRREYGLSRDRARQIRQQVKEAKAGAAVCPHCGGALPERPPRRR
jgi:voltage-gated potassium channel